MAQFLSKGNHKKTTSDSGSPTRLSPAAQKNLALIWKTAVLSIIVIGTNVIGGYSLTRGLRHVGVIESWSPMPYIHAFANPWVSVGVVFMIGWLFSRLALLSWADLSYVLPVTAFSYVLSAVTGAVYFNERVTRLHWVGIALITLGVGLVAVTPPETFDEEEDE